MKRLALLLFAAACVAPQTRAGDDDTPGEGNVTLKLDKDTAISSFLDAISAATNRPVLYNPNGQHIRGQKIGVTLEMEVPRSRLFDAFRAILTAYELTLVPLGPTGHEIYLAVDSRSTNNFVKNRAQFLTADQVPEYRDRDGLFVAVFFPLSNVEDLTYIRTALSTMVTPAGIGRVQEIRGVGLIVMDFAPTVYAISQIIERFDRPSPNTQVLESIELKHGKAKEVATAVQELWMEIVAPIPQRTRRGTRMPGPPPRIVPYAGRNAIVVRATRAEMDMIRGLVKKLDQPGKPRGLEVIRLQHVDAALLADTLTATLDAPTVFDPNAEIIPDSQSNSLIIAAERETMVGILDIIAALDVPPLKPEKK